MKWVLFTATLTLGSMAFAGENACERSCTESSQMCADQCKKALKKDHGDKVNFCSDKCKEFENECKKECAEEKKSR